MTIELGWKSVAFVVLIVLGLAVWWAWSINQARKVGALYADLERMAEAHQDEMEEAADLANRERVKADLAKQERDGGKLVINRLRDALAKKRKGPRTLDAVTEEARLCAEMVTLLDKQLALSDREVIALRNENTLINKALQASIGQTHIRKKQFEKCVKMTKRQKRIGIVRQVFTHTGAALVGAGIATLAQ